MNENLDKTIENVAEGVKSGNLEKVVGGVIGGLAITGAGTLAFLAKKGFTKARDKVFPVKEEPEENENNHNKVEVVIEKETK